MKATMAHVTHAGLFKNRLCLVFCVGISLFSYTVVASDIQHQTKKPVKLLIKIATRSRPQNFFHFLDLYYENLSNKNPYQFIISCDTDDSTMNNPEIRAKFSTYPNLTVCYGTSKSKIHACNRDIEKCDDFDIVLLSSDDMKPVLKDFDEVIVNKMLEYFPDTDGVLNFFDGSANLAVNTYPIIGRKFYDRFKFVYHPHYTSFWCDNELAAVSRMLDKEATFPEIVILLHCHYENNIAASDRLKQDDLYIRNEALEGADRILFTERKFLNFNISPSSLKYIKLSILIPAHKKDGAWLERIVRDLTHQAMETGVQESTEIVPLIVEDNSSTAMVNAMNKLITSSQGEYICFINPNSQITMSYLPEIHKHLINHPDCVSITGCIQCESNQKFVCSIKNQGSYAQERLLPYSYINPTRHDVAIQAIFRDVGENAAHDWACQVLRTQQLREEEYISQTMLILPVTRTFSIKPFENKDLVCLE